MRFFEENWLWRGTQSAIFYYVSCSPWIEWKYKRKRRNEANRAQKHRDEVVATQPGRVQQPGAFQTNADWAEEILMGPGPPKGWKRDPVVEKLNSGGDSSTQGKPSNSLDGVIEQSKHSNESEAVTSRHVSPNTTTQAVESRILQPAREAGFTEYPSELNFVNPGARRQSTLSSMSTSSTSSTDPADGQSRPRPSLERRLSTAMDNLRDTLRSTMRPEKWNWIRYERDDEILSGFNQRMTEMWNRATSFGLMEKRESSGDDSSDSSAPRKRRKRASTTDSDHFDYQKYTRNPEINELHPPVVSRLPATRDEAAWMILPPPSAAIMEGKARPQDEPAMRWPLAGIGRTPEDWKALARAQRTDPARAGSGQPDSIPELSDSFTEATSSDEEDGWRSNPEHTSAPPAESSQPAGLDLVYLKGGRATQETANWPIDQRA